MTQIIQAPNLSEFPNLIHGFTTKELGIDFDRLAVKLKVLRSQFYYLKQIHSDKVVYIGQGMNFSDLSPADALVTDRKDIIIGVKTADCVPILVYDNRQEVVAAIHAGHKGMLSGIIQKTLRVLTERLNCRFENLYVTMGPCISVKHYEVGDDLVEKFRSVLGDRFIFEKRDNAKPHLNLKLTAKMILEDFGIDPLHFMDVDLCTFERDDLFYSYRREKGGGRLFSFIGIVS